MNEVLLNSQRSRIRRLRHALEVAVASMNECTNHRVHHTAKAFVLKELFKDKRIARRNKETNELAGESRGPYSRADRVPTHKLRGERQ
jgi:hypothetical protein